MWSEDYQSLTHIEHFEAFDSLREDGNLAGELMWNFIDFNTPQGKLFLWLQLTFQLQFNTILTVNVLSIICMYEHGIIIN